MMLWDAMKDTILIKKSRYVSNALSDVENAFQSPNVSIALVTLTLFLSVHLAIASLSVQQKPSDLLITNRTRSSCCSLQV